MAKKKSDKSAPRTPKAGKAAEQRVAQLRDKLTGAMRDPLTREQIVRAIRAMMQEK